MKLTTRSAFSREQFANTQVYHQLNNKLIIVVRSWGSGEYNQKVVDEITHYLSTTQADIEVTTPFDYLESLSSLANRTRVAVLLAHDLFYKTDNRTEYVVGFEVLVLFRNKTEMAWSQVGRFSVAKLHEGHLNYINRIGTDLDTEILMPAQLIGLEKEVIVSSGSLRMDEQTKLIVSSTYGCEIVLNEIASDADSSSSLVEPSTSSGSYWFSVVTAG
jgi:hypothetical protein